MKVLSSSLVQLKFTEFPGVKFEESDFQIVSKFGNCAS